MTRETTTDIKPKKKTFQENQTLLSEMIRQVPGVLFQFYSRADGERGLRYVNERSESIIGVKANPDGFFERFSELVVPEHRQAFLESIDKAVRDVSEWHYEGLLRKPTGERVWFSAHSIPTIRETEIVFNGIFQDITQRKQDEETHRRLEAQLSSSLEIAHLGHWEYDVKRDLFTFNAPFYKIFKTTAGQVGGYTMSSAEYARRFVHPEDMEMVGEEVRKGIETTDRHFHRRLDHRILYADGSIGHITVHYFVVKDDQGKTVKIYGVNQDITYRKRKEEASRKEKEKYKAILQTAANGFWLTNLDGKLLEINDAYCRMSGYSRNELLMMQIPQLEGHLGPDEVAAKIELVLRQGYDRFETRHRHKRGHLYDVEVSVQHLAIEDGRLVIFLRNIDQMKKAEKEKRQLQAQLMHAQKMESVGRLAGGVAHDFNNMLSVILGYGELALELSDPSQMHAALREIIKAAKRSADITQQLLAFARKQPIAPKVIDLNGIVTGLLKMIQRLIGEDIHLTWRREKNLCPIKMDPSQIDQILVNLCVNARDAIQGVGNITIETSRVLVEKDATREHLDIRPGEFVLLTVSDDGEGMNKDTLQNVFEPFYTTKGEGKGTGLGLSMVYGIVKQNGGFIDVDSAPNTGSTFSIYFPVYKTAEESILSEKGAGRSIPRGRETILLVEDEPVILKMAQEMLESLGYDVISADTPQQAIDLASQYQDRIHLLLSDMVMPEMDGRALERRLRSIRPDVKHLFMSGYAAEYGARHGVLEESVNFIQKPFSRHTLSVKIRDVLDELL